MCHDGKQDIFFRPGVSAFSLEQRHPPAHGKNFRGDLIGLVGNDHHGFSQVKACHHGVHHTAAGIDENNGITGNMQSHRRRQVFSAYKFESLFYNVKN